MRVSPALQELHGFGASARRWRLGVSGLVVEGSPSPPRTEGLPETVRAIWTQHRAPINRAAERYGVPAELIVAVIASETQGKDAVHEASGWVDDERTPERVRAGVMQTTLAQARDALLRRGGFPAGGVTRAWLAKPESSILAGTALLREQQARTQFDPPLVAAAFATGVVREGDTPWGLFLPDGEEDACDRFVEWFNDVWDVLEDHPVRPTVSFWRYLASGRRLRLPLGAEPGLDVLRSLRDNETGHGGLFPLGLRRNVHTGIHLRPQDPSTPQAVHGLAPGWVVAARLGRGDAKAERLLGNHSGFVLLRHELEVGAGDERLAFYSLYLHLIPPPWTEGPRPAWAASEDLGPYERVGWLHQLRRARLGSLVVTDPAVDVPGTLRWPASLGRVDASTPAEEHGSVEVYGPDHAVERLELGAERAGRARALFRPTPADVEQALIGLAAGRVVTFDRPFLLVAPGEVLGYVQAPADGDEALPSGFLHWEVLAPAKDGASALTRLTELAREHLGFPETLFPVVPEADLLAAIDRGAPAEVLGPSLPEPDRAAFAQTDLRGSRRQTEKAVLDLYRRGRPLTFADPADDAEWSARAGADPDELRLPVVVRLENHEGLLDPATEEVGFEVRLEPEALGKGTVRVKPPVRQDTWTVRFQASAAATRAVLSPSPDVWLQAYERGGPGHAERLTELARATIPYRWRHVVVRARSAWSSHGIQQALTRWGETGRKDEQERVRWWGKGGEVPVLGKAGAERSLFAGDGPLPEQGEVDSLHPVTALLLLRTLASQGAVRLVDDWVPFSGEVGADELLDWGWVTPGEAVDSVAVGEPVALLAVAKGHATGLVGGKDHNVTFVAANDAGKLRVSRIPYRHGVAVVHRPAQAWGTWRLEVEGKEDAIRGTRGLPQTLDVRKPVLDVTSEPVEWRGRQRWLLRFRDDRPAALEGWVLLAHRVAGTTGEPTLSGVAIPVDARPVPTPAAHGIVLDDTGQFIVRANQGTEVPEPGSGFTYAEYRAAAGGRKEPRVNQRLAQLVGQVRRAYRGTPKPWISLYDLAEDGLSVYLKPYEGKKVHYNTEANQAELKRAVEAQPFDRVEPAPFGGLQVHVDAPSGRAGSLQVRFDPVPAYRKLLEEHPPGAQERLEVWFRFFYPNGGRSLGPDDARLLVEGESALSLDAEAARAKAPGGEALEVLAAKPSSVLTLPRVGAIELEVVEQRGAASLRLSAPLGGGTPAEWKAARPDFFWTGADGTERRARGTVASLRLTASLPFSQAGLKGATQLQVVARARAKETVFAGLAQEVPEETLEVDPSARLEDPRLEWEDDAMKVTCRARFWPPSQRPTLRVSGPTADDTRLGAHAVFAAGPAETDGSVELVARIPRARVREVLQPGDELEAELSVPGKVLGHTVAPVSARGRFDE